MIGRVDRGMDGQMDGYVDELIDGLMGGNARYSQLTYLWISHITAMIIMD